jgi:Protein of unknown function (DUF3800)
MAPRTHLDDLVEWASYFPSDVHTPLDRLAAALFVNSPCPGGRLMAMFTAYFDASGNGIDQPFVVVAGYVASYLQWRLFEDGWRKIHKDYSVEIPFHMADFDAALTNPAYKHQKNVRLDYVDIAKDPARACEFLKRLCICQQTLTNCVVLSIVEMSTYNNISSLLDMRKVIPPYALAARLCLVKIHEWEKTFGVQEPVECIFEEGDFEQGKFTELIIDEGSDAPIYKPKAKFAGLQAADHYCWENFFFLKREAQKREFPARDSLKLLLNTIPTMDIQPTAATLINLCHAKGIDPRTGVKHG